MSPCPLPPPYTWTTTGQLSLLRRGSVPLAAVLRRGPAYELSYADGTVLRDWILPHRLLDALVEHGLLPAPEVTP